MTFNKISVQWRALTFGGTGAKIKRAPHRWVRGRAPPGRLRQARPKCVSRCGIGVEDPNAESQADGI